MKKKPKRKKFRDALPIPIKPLPRTWAPTGVTSLVPESLDKETRKQIETDLKSRNIKAAECFFDALSEAISFYKSNKELAEKSKSAAARENLEKAGKLALSLMEQLNKLDGNSCQLIGEVTSGGVLSLRNNVGTIVCALRDAHHSADGYPKSGALPDSARLLLAVDIADAILTNLKSRPTTTKEGLFESVLTIVLATATGRKPEAVHELARRALKVEKKKSVGLTEYIPKKAK